MTTTAEHPSPTTLRHLSTLRELPQDELHALGNQLYVHEGRKGSVLLEIGATDDAPCT